MSQRYFSAGESLAFMPLVFPAEFAQLLQPMLKAVFCGTCVMLVTLTTGRLLAQPAQSTSTELANLREDLRGLTQRVNELQLQVEQLQRENTELHGKTNGAAQGYATVAQLNEAVAELNRTIKATVAGSKNETLQIVSVQMEKLAKQTNAALESLATTTTTRSPATATVRQTTFSDDFPKESINYTVQKGETLAVIAKKTGAKQQDIINANKIADPSHIQVGQTLIIPGGK
jgi:LysM repeat protein